MVYLKKENVIKNVLVKSMIGFPVGVTLLMIAYASVYFLVGDTVFYNEISQLQNIKTLIYQIIYSGLIWYLLFITFNAFIEIQRQGLENKDYIKHPYKNALTPIIPVLILIIALVLSLNTNIFSKNMVAMNFILIIIGYALVSLYLCIKFIKESHIIKEINNKIKEMHS